jgi:hypothetical protein
VSVASLRFEVLGLILVLLVAPWLAARKPRWLRRISHGWCRLGRRQNWMTVILMFLSFGLNVAVAMRQLPVPKEHDEFSYLLAADTFRHGRLTNPSHPLWVHFETFHVIQQPTYASKYPPTNGLIMALGKVVFGHEIVGVWIAAALAAGAMYWMLRAWVPGRWALLGGLLTVLHPRVQLDWGQCYWGGSMALLGGALLFGGWGHFRRRPTAWHALCSACGVVLLLNTRPFEGFIASVVTAAISVAWWWRRRATRERGTLAKLLLPLAAVFVPAAGWMAYYNYRVTGDFRKLPYQVHEETYMVSPVFLWQPLRRIEYRHPEMERFYKGWALDWYRRQRDLGGLLRAKGPIAIAMVLVFLRIVFATTWVMLPWVLRRREMRTVAVLLLAAIAPSLLVPWWQPHYLAPLLPLVFLLIVQALRCLRVLRCGGSPLGAAPVMGLMLLLAVSLTLEGAAHLRKIGVGWQWQRAEILRRLEAEPGRHLVLVRYRQDHSPLDEWVQNAADIDGARVVWARELQPAQNRSLLNYFRDRRAWLLNADAEPPVLTELEQ